MPDLLTVHAMTRGDKLALVEEPGGRTRTFLELNSRVNRLANGLRKLGVQAGERISGMSYNSIEGSEAAHAARKAGAVATPINYHLKPAEAAYVINDSGARVVFASSDFLATIEEARREVAGDVTYVAFGVDPPAGWLPYEELIHASDDSEPEDQPGGMGATMIYTSGTTGYPKGAFRPKGVNVENVLQIIQIFELTDSDIHLVAGPGYHSAVSFFSFLNTVLGGTNVIERRFEAAEALQLIGKHSITTTFMAPTLVARLLALPDELKRSVDHSALRAIFVGAAPFPQTLKEKGTAYFGEVLWEFYGATETGINTVLRPEDQLRKPASCGTAVPGQEIRLLDEEGVEVPTGMPGEFYVRNGWLAEYFNRPDATSSGFRDGFFSVGDIAYRDEDGYYYVCDRKIDMVISGGVNIYPAEVEAVLHEHPAVEDAAVIGVPNEEFGEEVKAVVKLRPGTTATELELIELCRQRLAGYKRPKSVDFVDDFPRDLAGKMQKRRLRDRYWQTVERRV